MLHIDEAYMLDKVAYHREMTNALLQEVQANPEYYPRRVPRPNKHHAH